MWLIFRRVRWFLMTPKPSTIWIRLDNAVMVTIVFTIVFTIVSIIVSTIVSITVFITVYTIVFIIVVVAVIVPAVSSFLTETVVAKENSLCIISCRGYPLQD
jgi:hypothetical protein